MPAPRKAQVDQMTASRGVAGPHDAGRALGWSEGYRFELQTQAMFMSMPGATPPDHSDNRPRRDLFVQARRTVNRGSLSLAACNAGPTVAVSAILSALAVVLIRMAAALTRRIHRHYHRGGMPSRLQ